MAGERGRGSQPPQFQIPGSATATWLLVHIRLLLISSTNQSRVAYTVPYEVCLHCVLVLRCGRPNSQLIVVHNGAYTLYTLSSATISVEAVQCTSNSIRALIGCLQVLVRCNTSSMRNHCAVVFNASNCKQSLLLWLLFARRH